ncbi:restriction endonuclease subunit S [Desulfoscipio geothermicus]|uniref:Type I restriction enzyme, S subunit n=1 Tax=Desulfoscipio geothermicus DSM 3669 TaxID=1121426 RepID=A0A1I6EHV7_9FIRM|nr:restriction endonuclease subunit S [Desulfoscipio geothermicus]SFR17323.1 type I restriction enzyme, S subunit [Desulfoscipio geothermicus DSM 3669]
MVVSVKRYLGYKRYKDSGIEWIGEVPEHWDVTLLKLLCKRITDGSHFSPETIDDGFPYVTVKDVINGKIDIKNCSKISFDDFSKLSKNGCRPLKNDILLSKDGTIGRAAIVKEENIVVLSSLAIISPKENKVLSNFLYYWLISSINIDQMYSFIAGAALKRLTIQTLNKMIMIAPTLEEQQKIAAFLDRETSKLDLLVEKKERLIELLKEKRQAIITQAVTKGLDPNVPMKDSGVEWLGEVPEHWNVLQIKHIDKNDSEIAQTGPFGAQLHASDYIDEGVPLILIKHINDFQIDSNDMPKISAVKAAQLSMYRLKENDIVFSRVGSMGRTALIKKEQEEWLISGQMLRLRIKNKNVNKQFLVYLFSSGVSSNYLQLMSVGSTRESINTNILRNMLIALPSLREQQRIIEYLDNKTSTINTLINKIHQQITKIKEYRQALISAAVTGKIDVRDEV